MKRVLLISPGISFSHSESADFLRDEISIDTAESAEEALERMEDDSYDLLVSELYLGGMNGDELCERIKKGGHDTYVILACSGKKNELKRCGRCGADAHVQTPIEADSLLHRISSTLKVHTPRATRVLVKVQVNGKIHSEPFFSISHNISVSGMMLEADQTLAKDDTITCSFYLPNSERLSASCKVMRVDKPEGGKNIYGILFEQMDEQGKALIQDFISTQRLEGNFY